LEDVHWYWHGYQDVCDDDVHRMVKKLVLDWITHRLGIISCREQRPQQSISATIL
jgi:hypothetical protein